MIGLILLIAAGLLFLFAGVMRLLNKNWDGAMIALGLCCWVCTHIFAGGAVVR